MKKVPPKSLSRRNFHGKKAQEAPRSGLDVGALLSERSTANKNRISAENAIPEFKQILADAEDVETIKNSVSQMSGIIRNWVVNSMGDSNYGRATEGIRVMRQECIELEEPGLFNGFLRDLKSQIFEEKLGGDRREMWWQIRSNRLGLIQKDIAPQSEVEEDEARQVSKNGEVSKQIVLTNDNKVHDPRSNTYLSVCLAGAETNQKIRLERQL